ncbi:MAG: MerC family mercury resistance protein [Pseudomonadota bacterium]
MAERQDFGGPEGKKGAVQVAGQPAVAAGRLPFGFWAYVATAISVFFCYAHTLVELIAPALGTMPFAVNPHLQAIFMWGFALAAVIALYRDRSTHGRSGPLVLGALGIVVILGTLYGYYDVLILILGYLFLVVAVLLNPAQRLLQLNRSVSDQAHQLAELNGSLEQRVRTQVDEIERLARLKRFLSADVVELITEEGNEALLNSHRRAIACLFCDVRNFTSFSEAVEPEEVMDVLRSVHEEMGKLVARQGGTIGYRAGDGLMVIFNDPLPCEAPVARAVALAQDMTAVFAEIQSHWRRLGHELGFGIGIAYGYATLGLIGSEGRYDYTAIGNVVNIAARLCDRAEDGEALMDRRAVVELEQGMQSETGTVESLGPVELKGLERPVEIFRYTS